MMMASHSEMEINKKEALEGKPDLDRTAQQVQNLFNSRIFITRSILMRESD